MELKGGLTNTVVLEDEGDWVVVVLPNGLEVTIEGDGSLHDSTGHHRVLARVVPCRGKSAS